MNRLVDPAKYRAEASVSTRVVRKGTRQKIKHQTPMSQILYTTSHVKLVMLLISINSLTEQLFKFQIAHF